ncbi:hypothetical protein EGR_10299 [Echinococcus granulosus]|uniref:Uncharacterized protein n=1 Tax=Echinococcus granulosus TaxID=6210 RepID=W6UMW0_ECHGR|nr:hypothetical protein EGR_10299 [Echinococcus granulosus]EUB54834.1 hypothetical protein EGR_10299 [Echinococcus granulosus]
MIEFFICSSWIVINLNGFKYRLRKTPKHLCGKHHQVINIFNNCSMTNSHLIFLSKPTLITVPPHNFAHKVEKQCGSCHLYRFKFRLSNLRKDCPISGKDKRTKMNVN